MSHARRRLRAPLVLAALAASATAFTAPAAASPYAQERTFAADYTCTLPGVGAQPTALSGQYEYWTGITAGSAARGRTRFDATPAGLLDAASAAGATEISVAGTWAWLVTAPDGSTYRETKSFDAGAQSVATGSGTLTATVNAPSSRALDQNGAYTFGQDGLSFVLRATDAAGAPIDLGLGTEDDGDPTSSTVPCTGSVAVAGGAAVYGGPSTPVIERVETTSTSATLFLAANSGTAIYQVLEGDVVVKSEPAGGQNQITIGGLTPGSTHTYTVVGLGIVGSPARSEPVTFTLPPAGQTVRLVGPGSLNVRGSLVVNATTQAVVSGTIDSAGAFTGTTALGSAFANTTALGFLPVKAALAFTAVGTTTGSTSAVGAPTSSFTLTTTQDIAIKSATFLGVRIPTGTCHTATPPTISLSSTTPGANLSTGGTAVASFGLGRLTTCSTLGQIAGTSGGRGKLLVKLAAPLPPAPTPAT